MSTQPATPQTPKPASIETLALLARIADGIERLLEISAQTAETSAGTAEALAKFGEIMHAAGQPAAGQPVAEYRDFAAEAIILGYTDKGEPSYKIIGHPYSKFGVRTWPEVLPALGIDAAQLKPGPNPYHGNVRAVLGEHGPKKVIGPAG